MELLGPFRAEHEARVMRKRSDDSRRRLDAGGFAYGEIPPGFARSREPHEDAPLSRRGKVIFYATLGVVVVAGVIVIWLSRAT